MRVAGVEMVDRDPIEFSMQIFFHAGHEIAYEGLEVGHAAGILRRDDQPELVGVTLLPFEKAAAVNTVPFLIIELADTTIAGDAIAHEVVLVRACGGKIRGAVPGDAGLDDHPAPAGRRRRQAVERALAAAQLGDRPLRQRIGPGRFGCPLSRRRLGDDACEASRLHTAIGSRLTELWFEFCV